ncbi:hypothetical protein Bpfe_021521, partial [Biomphalaria pfeifferi]
MEALFASRSAVPGVRAAKIGNTVTPGQSPGTVDRQDATRLDPGLESQLHQGFHIDIRRI